MLLKNKIKVDTGEVFFHTAIPRFPMDFGKDPFFPMSAKDLMLGNSLLPPFSVIFFWFWCLWRSNRTSRTFSFNDSSNCLAATALSITSSVKKKRETTLSVLYGAVADQLIYLNVLIILDNGSSSN